MSREAFEREVERGGAARSRGEAVCTLMRLGALLGERNGHSGVFALDEHAEPLHFYPLQLYEFDDGVFVVSAARPELVGAEASAIGGIPIASLAKQAGSLVPRDNAQTLRARRPSYLVAAEILDGLGVPEGARRTFALDHVDVALEPIPAAEYVRVLNADRRLPRRPGVRYLERRDERAWIEQIAGGRILLVAYNVTRGDTRPLADEIAARAQKTPPRAVVLDLRHNGGGDNTTYGPLLVELERRAATAQLLVLTSRVTFSAAMQLVVDLETKTDALFLGEATGASPNHFGDAVPVELPAAGLVSRVATISWETAGADDVRPAREPDISVPLRSEDFFEDRDPVLDAALAALA